MESNSEKDKKNLIFGKYRLTKIIGTGSFGYVYQGKNIINNKNVAVKVEKKDNGLNLLEKESFYLYNLKGIGIPEVISFGYSGKYNILVQTLLGDTLGHIFFKNNYYFSLKDICMFSTQILHRIEHVHSKYIIHRDIKPENFLIGDPDKYLIYIIDFGLSKKYKSSRTNKHVQFQLTKKFTGTARYASINAVRGVEQSRRDDLEAIGYMLLFFFNRGKLPWQGVSCKAKAEKYIKIYTMKKNLNFEQFCKNMPKEIVTYVKYCRELEFEQKPDYEYLRGLFENILKNKGLSNDLHFSWIKDLSILKNIDKKNTISQYNIGKRRTSPQSRIIKKLENSREKLKEKENEIENDFTISKGNNSLKNKENIVMLKTNTHSPQYIIHRKFLSSGDNILKKSRDSENYKSGIAQYNISIDDGEQMTEKTSISKVKDVLHSNKEPLKQNKSASNNNSLYYFSGNVKDLSKSLVITNSNEQKKEEYGINIYNGNNNYNNHLNDDNKIKKQKSTVILPVNNRVLSSNALNETQDRNLHNLFNQNAIKSFSFINTLKPLKEEINEEKDIKDKLNINLSKTKELINYNKSKYLSSNQSTQNIFNNNNRNNDSNKNKNIMTFTLKNKYRDIKITKINNNNNNNNNNIKKMLKKKNITTNTNTNSIRNTGANMIRNRSNICININEFTNNSTRNNNRNSNIFYYKNNNNNINNYNIINNNNNYNNKSINIKKVMKAKRIENNTSKTLKKNKKRKIIKMKVKDLPNTINTTNNNNSINNTNYKSATNILKQNIAKNNLLQHFNKNSLLNTSHNFENNTNMNNNNILKTENNYINIVDNSSNHLEGKINKIKNMTTHINTQKTQKDKSKTQNNSQNHNDNINSINQRYKKISIQQILKNNTSINRNNNSKNYQNNNLNDMNMNQNLNNSRISKYKNLRHKVLDKDNIYPIQNNYTRKTENYSQKHRLTSGILNNIINNCNTFNNTINTNNHNNTIISIYNNYNIEKYNNNNKNNNNRYGFASKKKDGINIALDTLNNINKEKNQNYYCSYNGYKIKLNNYKNLINLNQNKNVILNNPSLNLTSNQNSLNSKINNNNNLYNTQILSNKDFYIYDNNSNSTMNNTYNKNFISYYNQDINFLKLKQNSLNNKYYHISPSKPNLYRNGNGVENSYRIKRILDEFNQKKKTKKIERNNTLNYKNFPLFVGNIKTEKNCNSMNIPRSKSYLYGVNFRYDNINNKIRMNDNYNCYLPFTNRKNTEVLHFGKNGYNMYDFKLMDKNKKGDIIHRKRRAQSRDYGTYNNRANKDNNGYNLLRNILI